MIAYVEEQTGTVFIRMLMRYTSFIIICKKSAKNKDDDISIL